jgi:hypothetical protein
MELKQEAIFQARLDARWQKDQPVAITMKELTYPDCIHYARFLPGAEFLVLALRRSIILSRIIKQDGEFSIDRIAEFVIKNPVKIVHAKAIYTKKEGMFLAAQAVRLDNRRECVRYICILFDSHDVKFSGSSISFIPILGACPLQWSDEYVLTGCL